MNKLLALYRKYEEVIRYLIVGAVTTLVSLAIFYGSTRTFLNGYDPVQLQIANVISWTGAVVFAYVVNRRFVFDSRNPHIFREFVAFVGTRVLTLLLDMGVTGGLALILDYNFAKLIAMVLVTIGNYVVAKLLVFRKKS